MSWMHIFAPDIYEFEGWIFEFHSHMGPWPLKKNGERRERAGRKFFAVFERWHKMPEAKRKKYHIGGGCRWIEIGGRA